MYSFNLMSCIDRLCFVWCVIWARRPQPPHIFFLLFPCTSTRRKQLLKVSDEMQLAVSWSERRWLRLYCLPRVIDRCRKRLVHTSLTRTSVQMLCLVSLHVCSSNTNSPFPGVSIQGIFLIATCTFCRQYLVEKLQTALSEHMRLKEQKEWDALPLFCF